MGMYSYTHYLYHLPSVLYIIIYNTPHRMGNWLSRPQKPQTTSNIPQPQRPQPLTIFDVWKQSNKQLQDILALIQSQQSRQQNHTTVRTFISTLAERVRLQHILKGTEQHLLRDPSVRDRECDINLLDYVHRKYQNIWFVWSHLDSGSSPAYIHENLLIEVSEMSKMEKLRALYRIGNISEYQHILKNAIKTNFPLVTKDHFKYLFKSILEEDIYIEDDQVFILFMKACLEAHNPQNIEYAEKIRAFLPNEEETFAIWHPNDETNTQSNIICSWAIELGQFLWAQNGYPQGLQLIFKAVSSTNHAYSKEEQQIYLSIRLYSFLLYNLNLIQLQYDKFRLMKVNAIIHLILNHNNLTLLNNIHQIYEETKKLRKEGLCMSSFDYELSEYIFSSQCTFQLCVQVLVETDYVDMHSNLNQNLFMNKIQGIKFQTFLESRHLITELLQKYQLSYRKQPIDASVFDEMFQIARLFSALAVNERVLLIWNFFFLDENLQHPQVFLQERALYLLKNFISKYFIASRNKKICLDERVSQPIVLEVSKPNSIFEIVQWLHAHAFCRGVQDLQQLHQVIIQLMLSFYRYDDANAILNDDRLMKKYGLHREKIQMVVIDNISNQLQKQKISKVSSEIQQQLKMLKGESIQIQSIKATYSLLIKLNENGIQPNSSQKQKIDIGLMKWLIEEHSQCIQVLNFDEIYEDIRAINSDFIINEDETFTMTNQLLLFKSELAAKAYVLGKKKLGNELIDQISRFNPPWLTSQLIKIFKQTKGKMDKRVYGVALNNCAKGKDLQYLMELWKNEGAKDSKDKLRKMGELTEYFQTGREYLVIDGDVIMDEERYRNLIAQTKFSDETMSKGPFQIFFTLLGTQPERAFQYALRAQIDPLKIDIFLKEGMKLDILNQYSVSSHLLKFLHFTLARKNDVLLSEYSMQQLNLKQIKSNLKQISTKKQKSIIEELYSKSATAFLFAQTIPYTFINTYLSSLKTKNAIAYELLFTEQRKNILLDLRQQPMGRTDIIKLNHVCKDILNINFIQLCIFSLCSLANKSQNLSENAQNILQKIITLTANDKNLCMQMVEKLMDKVFSVRMLLKILEYMKERQNPIYRQILGERHIKILQSLGAVQEGQQFNGMIPQKYFWQPITYEPKWPLSLKHSTIIKRCGSKTNIFVISKVLFFMYGMNSNIERKILDEFVKEHPDEDLQDLKEKLGNKF